MPMQGAEKHTFYHNSALPPEQYLEIYRISV